MVSGTGLDAVRYLGKGVGATQFVVNLPVLGTQEVQCH